MVIVVGSLNMDLVVRAPRIPRPGETILGSDFKQIPGGKGANQACAAAKLGAPTKMLGAVGNDLMGKSLKDSLHKDGVDISMVLEKESFPTGVASIVVEDSGNNAIAVAPGANGHFSISDLEKMEDIIKGASVLLVQLETPLDTVESALEIAKKHNIKTILNPAPAIDLDPKILSLVDILTPNETELQLLSGKDTDSLENIEAAANSLLDRGVSELVVTLGSKGSIHIKKDYSKVYPAYRVRAVDTTAAGDSFNGALAVSIGKGEPLENAILFATRVAAITVTKHGAQTSLPSISEVENFDKWYMENRYEEEYV